MFVLNIRTYESTPYSIETKQYEHDLFTYFLIFRTIEIPKKMQEYQIRPQNTPRKPPKIPKKTTKISPK